MKKSLLLILSLLIACGSPKDSSQKDLLDDPKDVSPNQPAITENDIRTIIQRIPSPLEVAVLLKEIGSKYDTEILNSPDNVSKYNTAYKKALNLGIYGTDMGYVNIFEHNEDAISYLEAIRGLAEDLNIGQFFDFRTIHHLAINSKNLDSLLLITTQNFNEINIYLQDQKRSKMSILLLSGGWLEALHLAGRVYSANPEAEALKERIGEQKIILEHLVLLLSYFGEQDSNISNLVEDLHRLKTIFDEIKISYTFEESTYEVVNGVLKIKDNSTSTINITDEQVADINTITEEIRAKIID